MTDSDAPAQPDSLTVPAANKCVKRAPIGSIPLPQKVFSVLNGPARQLRKLDRHFDALRRRIMAAEPRRANRNDAVVVALTSRTPGEGVSTVALALARSFARNGDGRILLIDADTARNGLAARAPGDVATRIAGPDDLNPQYEIASVEDWEVDLLAVAAPGGKLLEGPQWEDYLSAMRSRYDVIVIDAGSLQQGIAQIWFTVTSQILLVVDTTRTTVQALERLAKELKTAKLVLSGIVLNKREFPIPQFLY